MQNELNVRRGDAPCGYVIVECSPVVADGEEASQPLTAKYLAKTSDALKAMTATVKSSTAGLLSHANKWFS